MRTPRLGSTLAVALAAVALVSAQQPQQPTFRAGTNVVRVDMFATRDGRAVEDLKASDVEILEDGVKQTIESFEFVRVRPPVAEELRAEPNSVAESRQMAQDPRARVFVIFLDTYHTDFTNAVRLRGALQQFIDRVVGQDDLLGLMTPEMSAAGVTLGRRSTVVSRLLDITTWGRRNRLNDDDPVEQQYEGCYAFEGSIAADMKARRREKLSLDALEDLVVHLGGLRDERKAVFAVSEGWLQFAPDQRLARRLQNTDPGQLLVPPGPVDRGVARRGERSTAGNSDLQKCEAERIALANMDNRDRLQRMGEDANRVNVTFYPIGAQGLAVFDSDIGPEPPPPLQQDAANLRSRQNGLRMLADMTDGVSIVNTNNIGALLKKVVDDLSSYYLMTYSSTNSKLDGRFRSISVRVARPGVQTRARRGYRALTPGQVPASISGPAAAPVVPPSQSGVLAALTAMAFNPRAELRLRASAYASSGHGAFWLVGTLDDATRRGAEWAKGTADVAVRAADGRTVLTTAVPFGADGGFAVQVPDAGALAPGDYTIRVRAKGAGGATIDDTARVTIAGAPPVIGDAVVWRRRPATGPTYFRTADPRASRTDRLRFEYATAATAAPSATLLDRTGQPMAVPLQVTTRDEAGTRWIVVDLTLSPLAPSDYAVEVKAGDAVRTTAFRVVP